MTYEQIWAGKIVLERAVGHLRNRAMTLRPPDTPHAAVNVLQSASFRQFLPHRFEVVVAFGGPSWMPRNELDAVVLLEARYWELEGHFQGKRSKKRKAVSA